MASLYALIAAHGDAVEADLHRYYQLDLVDFAKGKIGWRKLINLVRHLPPDSATVIARSGPAAVWTVDQHLLASVVDLLAAANWQRAGNRKNPKPTPLPRPGQKTRHPVTRKFRPRTIDEIDRIMAEWSTPKPDRTETTVIYQ